jgi:hypothetical protein
MGMVSEKQVVADRGLNTNHLVANLTHKGDTLAPDCGVDLEDNSDDSSADARSVKEGEGKCDEDELSLDKEGRQDTYGDLDEYDDLEEYGERLVDEEGRGEEVGEGRVEKVRYNLQE